MEDSLGSTREARMCAIVPSSAVPLEFPATRFISLSLTFSSISLKRRCAVAFFPCFMIVLISLEEQITRNCQDATGQVVDSK